MSESEIVNSEKIDLTSATRAVADSTSAYVYVVDDETDEILMINDYYSENIGIPSSAMEGKKCWKFVQGDDGGKCESCPRGERDAIEFFNPTIGIWSKVEARPIKWIDGRNAHVVTALDISKEKLLREELAHLAFYDRDMNIPNRSKIVKDIGDRPYRNFCLLAFDYISLRYINDAYGRTVVNSLFDEVIAWIKSFDLHNYEIYRVDSDEFCLLFDNVDMISIGGLADRLFERFEDPWHIKLNGETTSITCKIAVCVIDARVGFDTADDILAVIDRTLDISKENRSVALYNQDMDAAIKKDLQLELSLKNCIQNEMMGFDVFFQPIVDPYKKKWAGIEALCRWESPEFGKVPPLVFIRIAEQIGMINKLGNWVLDNAIGVCSNLQLDEIPEFFVDVNLSTSQLSDDALINNVLSALQKYNFPAGKLSLEVTESQDIANADFSQTTIERLKSLDVKLALDDFGTGYSNFNNLRSLPVSILKTEKSFIDNIAFDEYQQYLSKVLVDLAHAADMKLIAEGVETETQMEALISNKADFMQGYLFARPLTLQELMKNTDKFNEGSDLFSIVK